MNIYNMVIISFNVSANSNIFVNSGLIGFCSHYWSYFSVLLHGWWLLNWIPGIVNFTLLGAGHFCYPINILNLFFSPWDAIKKQFGLLCLAFKICSGRIRAAFNLKLIISHYWNKILLSTLLDFPWDIRFSFLAGENRSYFWSCVNSKECFLWYFWGGYLLTSSNFLTHVQWSVLFRILEGGPTPSHLSHLHYMYCKF